MSRRDLDAYYTPRWAVDVLQRLIPIDGATLEPCVGKGAIRSALNSNRPHKNPVYTNDIDPTVRADWHFDAALNWPSWLPPCQWVVTNPPFKQAKPILDSARAFAQRGVAFLLRLSWLEPTFDRNLEPHETPTHIIVLPRISFTGNGKTDNVTCAWMIWSPYIRPGITIIPKGKPWAT